MQIEFVESVPATGEALTAIAVLVFEGPTLSEAAEELDRQTGGAVSRAAAVARTWLGRVGPATARCHGPEHRPP